MDQVERASDISTGQRSLLSGEAKLLYVIIAVLFVTSATVAQPSLVIENGRVIIGNGEIEEGKLADLVVVEGNPFEDLLALEDVEIVLKGGK